MKTAIGEIVFLNGWKIEPLVYHLLGISIGKTLHDEIWSHDYKYAFQIWLGNFGFEWCFWRRK